MDEIILLESRHDWESGCTRVFQNQPSRRFAGRPSNLYPGAGFLSLDGSRCYTLRQYRAYPTRWIRLDRSMVKAPPSRCRCSSPSAPPGGHRFRWLL